MSGRRGLTLVEVLIVAVLFSLFMGAFFSMTTAGQNAWLRTDAQLETVTNTQRALNRIVEELRRTSINGLQTLCPSAPTVPCPPPSTNTGQVTLRFRQDPTTATPLITYTLNTQRQLVRGVDTNGDGVNDSSAVVAANLDSFLPSVSSGGLVTLTVSSQPRPAQSGTFATQTVTSQVWVQIQ